MAEGRGRRTKHPGRSQDPAQALGSGCSRGAGPAHARSFATRGGGSAARGRAPRGTPSGVLSEGEGRLRVGNPPHQMWGATIRPGTLARWSTHHPPMRSRDPVRDAEYAGSDWSLRRAARGSVREFRRTPGSLRAAKLGGRADARGRVECAAAGPAPRPVACGPLASRPQNCSSSEVGCFCANLFVCAFVCSADLVLLPGSVKVVSCANLFVCASVCSCLFCQTSSVLSGGRPGGLMSGLESFTLLFVSLFRAALSL